MTEINEYKDHLFALIVAGGGGTRLWPKSRNDTPKQFLPLVNGETLTRITIKRLNAFIPWDRIVIVTVSEAYKKEIIKEVPLINKDNIVVEPLRRNTAAAHAIGALKILKQDPDAVIINAAADHLVKPQIAYERIMKKAARVAYEHKTLVAVGIQPTYPHTGLGYIKKGKRMFVIDGKSVYQMDGFKEKPDLSTAEKYLASKKYYWNANMYVWRADNFIESLRKHTPEVGEKMYTLLPFLGTSEEKENIQKVYEQIPEISVDYAVSEKEKNFVLLLSDFNWSDIGDWKELWENLEKDHMGNVIIDGDAKGGEIINIDTSDALIHKDGRLIAVIDMDNVVIVDTKDVLLVCPKSRAQNVKKIVELLKANNRKELL